MAQLCSSLGIWAGTLWQMRKLLRLALHFGRSTLCGKTNGSVQTFVLLGRNQEGWGILKWREKEFKFNQVWILRTTNFRYCPSFFPIWNWRVTMKGFMRESTTPKLNFTPFLLTEEERFCCGRYLFCFCFCLFVLLSNHFFWTFLSLRVHGPQTERNGFK